MCRVRLSCGSGEGAVWELTWCSWQVVPWGVLRKSLASEELAGGPWASRYLLGAWQHQSRMLYHNLPLSFSPCSLVSSLHPHVSLCLAAFSTCCGAWGCSSPDAVLGISFCQINFLRLLPARFSTCEGPLVGSDILVHEPQRLILWRLWTCWVCIFSNHQTHLWNACTLSC